jgi:hypothetical protein
MKGFGLNRGNYMKTLTKLENLPTERPKTRFCSISELKYDKSKKLKKSIMR